jgi:cyclopropane-fatty-acyl-phospholipid synthase
MSIHGTFRARVGAFLHIFPDSMSPSAAQIAAAVEGRFVIEDWHGFGTEYDLTLQARRRNIEHA